jgi:O6-methylguanine-DNA--protein-cysteine methyltransferase
VSSITTLEEIINELTRRIDTEVRMVSSGEAKSYEDYVRRTASIKAYRSAIQIIYDVVEQKPREERN